MDALGVDRPHRAAPGVDEQELAPRHAVVTGNRHAEGVQDGSGAVAEIGRLEDVHLAYFALVQAHGEQRLAVGRPQRRGREHDARALLGDRREARLGMRGVVVERLAVVGQPALLTALGRDEVEVVVPDEEAVGPVGRWQGRRLVLLPVLLFRRTGRRFDARALGPVQRASERLGPLLAGDLERHLAVARQVDAPERQRQRIRRLVAKRAQGCRQPRVVEGRTPPLAARQRLDAPEAMAVAVVTAVPERLAFADPVRRHRLVEDQRRDAEHLRRAVVGRGGHLVLRSKGHDRPREHDEHRRRPDGASHPHHSRHSSQGPWNTLTGGSRSTSRPVLVWLQSYTSFTDQECNGTDV